MMQHLDRQERLFIDTSREFTVTHGEQPGVVAVASKDYRDHWCWAVYDRLATHRGRAESLEAATGAIMAKIAELDGLFAAIDEALIERKRDAAVFDLERQTYAGPDAALADLYRAYNARLAANERRKVSHPAYYTSGTHADDEAALAGLRVRIEGRKTELAQQEAA